MTYIAPFYCTPIEIAEHLKTLILKYSEQHTVDGVCIIPFGNPEFVQLIIASLKTWITDPDVAIKLKSLKIIGIRISSEIIHIVL